MEEQDELHNQLVEIVEALDQLPKDEQEKVLSAATPEQREAIESVRQQRAMTSFIVDKFGGEEIHFVDEDGEGYAVDQSGRRKEIKDDEEENP